MNIHSLRLSSAFANTALLRVHTVPSPYILLESSIANRHQVSTQVFNRYVGNIRTCTSTVPKGAIQNLSSPLFLCSYLAVRCTSTTGTIFALDDDEKLRLVKLEDATVSSAKDLLNDSAMCNLLVPIPVLVLVSGTVTSMEGSTYGKRVSKQFWRI